LNGLDEIQIGCRLVYLHLRTKIINVRLVKSAGSDNIIGEIFTASPIFFAPLLKKLFNYIFNHGIYPDFWTECLVMPVPKSGDLSDPNNNRPIVLVSVLSKL
jgi:hypothetical protein